MSPRHGANSRRGFLAIILAIGFACLAGCGHGPGSSARPTSKPGGTERIVALSPAVAVMLRDLGLADRIVGKHDYDLVLGDNVPAVGHQEAADYEKLLAVQPTHVIIEWGSRPLPPRLVEMARDHGWKLVNITLLTLDDIAHTVDDLAIMFGVVDPRAESTGPPPSMGVPEDLHLTPRFTDPADRLEVELPSANLAKAWSKRGDGFADVGPVLLLAATDPIGALGPGSFHQQILERIGGMPAMTEGSAWMELDAEDVLRLAPSAIVLIAPRNHNADAGAIGAEQIRARLGRIATLDIPAVRSGRLGLIDDPLALLPSTSMAHFADELADLLTSWRNGPGGP
ncbi:MAG: hypothetical protein H6810_11265 [Phycisphaeraceae bacterium]|nr:MAG: hypothetical protein H6810_11265 [Phycisphaeraceae bacterium]